MAGPGHALTPRSEGQKSRSRGYRRGYACRSISLPRFVSTAVLVNVDTAKVIYDGRVAECWSNEIVDWSRGVEDRHHAAASPHVDDAERGCGS